MALAIARVLVALTRTRELATKLAEKKNLQRLFLMVKQLANGVGHRLQSSFMLILRHIVEDEDTLRQIMRSEIKAMFNTRSSARHPDTNTYVRELYHLVLRSPSIFVEVTNEIVKLSQWQPQSGGAAGVVLKEAPDAISMPEGQDEQALSHQENGNDAAQPAASIEALQESVEEASKSKVSEVRPPVVEHPDGVIHFILSELLNYKDVEDKEVVTDIAAAGANGARDQASLSPTTYPSASTVTDATQPKPEKAKFKPEEHPIFSYRCFLMYSLTELLHSYNRTKVEFHQLLS